MKKEECCSVFMTTLMIAIPVGAVVAILLEIFIPIDFGVIDYIAEVSIKHGSTIAGLLGILGVLILVWNQDKTTNKILDNNLQMMKKEAFELKRAKANECATKIGCKIDILRGKKDYDFNSWASASPGYDFFEDVKENLYFLDKFFHTYEDNVEGIASNQCVSNFIRTYESIEWKDGAGKYNLKAFLLLLGSFVSLHSAQGYAKKQNDMLLELNIHNDDASIEDALHFYREFDDFTHGEICFYIIEQMSFVVMPTLIYVINEIEHN